MNPETISLIILATMGACGYIFSMLFIGFKLLGMIVEGVLFDYLKPERIRKVKKLLKLGGKRFKRRKNNYYIWVYDDKEQLYFQSGENLVVWIDKYPLGYFDLESDYLEVNRD